jgi:cbb3-type cytochrome oxidase subunit 3
MFMQKTFEKKSDFIARISLVFGIMFVLACLGILTLRISSVLRDSLYAQTTGGEAPSLYGIYKVWTGRALYEPLSKTATPMIFNYLFYYVYGYLAKIFVNKAEFFPFFSRIVTLVATLCYVCVLLFYIWRQTRRDHAKKKNYLELVPIYLLPFVIFIGPFIGWWYLTARPDLFGLGLELCGLILLLTSKKIYGNGRVILTTCIFWLAWSFKQSLILVYLGFLTVLLVDRKFRQLFISSIFFAILCCLPLAWFRLPYVENIIRVPAMNPWYLKDALNTCIEVFVTGAYLYLPAIFLMSRQLMKRFEPNANRRILIIIFAITVIGGFLNSERWGSGRNCYFPSYLVGSIFVIEYLILSWEKDDEYRKGLSQYVCISLFFMGLVLSSLYLILPNKFGRIFLLTQDQREANKKIIAIIKAARKPTFAESHYLALPWNSGQDYLDIVDDTTYIFSGITIVEQRIKNRYYAEAFLFENSRWTNLFEESGYKQTDRLFGLARFKVGDIP